MSSSPPDHNETRDLEELSKTLLQFVATSPSDALAHRTLGITQSALGKKFAAKSWLQQAVEMRPTYAEAWVDLGNVLEGLNDHTAAAQAYARAIELTPGYTDSQTQLARLSSGRGWPLPVLYLWPQARKTSQCTAAPVITQDADPIVQEIVLRDLLVGDPDNANVLTQLAMMLMAQNRIVEAELFVRHVLIIDPGNVDAGLVLGSILQIRGQHVEALDHALALCDHAPSNPIAALIALQRCMELCRWDGFAQRLVRTCDLLRQNPHVVEPLECAQLGFSSQELAAFAEKFSTRYTRQNRPALRPPRDPNGKVVLGYMSADFHDHPVGRIAAQLFPYHDRSKFNLKAYSLWIDDGPTRRQIVSTCDEFTDLYGVSKEAAAERITNDGVDILIDLTGHTKNNRADILALRPAPVQINYLGYPGTMGSGLADYMIVDHTLAPDDAGLAAFECIVRKPGSFFPGILYPNTHDTTPLPLSRHEFGLPEDGVVFCNFTAANRLLPNMFKAWLQILLRVPGSVFWLSERHPYAQQRLRNYAAENGVRPERILFSARLPQDLYLSRYRIADIFLDTLPFNAHSTASDAIWMGCPVLTCMGNTFPGRVAASLVRAAGTSELVTETLNEYEDLAVQLGNTPSHIAELRQRLSLQHPSQGLFDTEQHVRYLEDAFIQMHERQKMGLAPKSFDVAPLK